MFEKFSYCLKFGNAPVVFNFTVQQRIFFSVYLKNSKYTLKYKLPRVEIRKKFVLIGSRFFLQKVCFWRLTEKIDFAQIDFFNTRQPILSLKVALDSYWGTLESSFSEFLNSASFRNCIDLYIINYFFEWKRTFFKYIMTQGALNSAFFKINP